MPEDKIPVVSEATIVSAREGLQYRESGNPNVESLTSVMRRENPALFTWLQDHARHMSRGNLGLEAVILTTGVMLYGMLNAQVAADNAMPKSP
jgi:hypothetical protein